MTFDYKKYSLENLDKWVEDAINSSEASPQEIYDTIKKVVEDNYYTYKHRTEQCYELLALLNGNGVGHASEQNGEFGVDKDDNSPEHKNSWSSFWGENYYPEEHKKSKEPTVEDLMPSWGHSDMEALRYAEEAMNAMCSKAEPDAIQPKKLATYDEMVADGWTMTADGFWIKEAKEPVTSGTSMPPRQNRWVLPVQQQIEEGIDNYFIQLPDDLLDQVNWKENDQLIWIDRNDGTFELRKV